MKPTLLFLFMAAASLLPLSAQDLLICSSAEAPTAIREEVAAFIQRAEKTPLIHALITTGNAGSIQVQESEGLIAPNAYDRAAHHHLIVIGLPESDPLLKKVWGHIAGIRAGERRFESLGWGVLIGDIGWVESDRNPFLHSRRMKSAPEGTLLVKIGGTSEKGVLAALAAFEKGLNNGVVPAGEFTRPEQTLLDFDPLLTPPLLELPEELALANGQKAVWAGWTQIPAQEYRAVLEVARHEPKAMWRLKYIAPGFLKEKSIIRWQSGPHRMAYGNAMTIMQFDADTPMESLMAGLTGDKFSKVPLPGNNANAWEAKEAVDQVVVEPHWTMIASSTGPFAVLTTLPPAATGDLLKRLGKGGQP